MAKEKQIAVSLPTPVREHLESLCAEYGCTHSSLAALAIETFLNGVKRNPALIVRERLRGTGGYFHGQERKAQVVQRMAPPKRPSPKSAASKKTASSKSLFGSLGKRTG